MGEKWPPKVVTLPEFEMNVDALTKENLILKSQIAALKTKEQLNCITKKVFGCEIQFRRLPSEDSKKTLLAAIAKAMEILSLRECLITIGMSFQRFRLWKKREVKCELRDHLSCPRISPTKMLPSEIRTIGELLSNSVFNHLSVTALSILAKRTRTVMASLSTWHRVNRENGLKRSYKRIYPAKPMVGVRAALPFQIWHMDLTIIRLENGTRAFIQCVIDNYSRFVLAWQVTQEYGGIRTKELLINAISKAKELGLKIVPNVYVDAGCENINDQVDLLISSGLLTRTIAQIDVIQSNSMIEALFRRLKHFYLYFIKLTSFDDLIKAVDHYMTQSNEYIPLAVLKGATPFEAITGQ